MKITITLSKAELEAIRNFNETREAVGYISAKWSPTDTVWVKVADAVEAQK